MTRDLALRVVSG